MEARGPLVTHVSDTALWIAMLRARETARPDAIFRDPLAERLAGARGREIADRLSKTRRDDWPMVVRTRIIDDLVLRSLAEGADRVLNLAAGLDTRPYRLALPPSLTWIEADLPGMIEEKERLLASEQPVCRLSREKVDLTDAAARNAFLDSALAGANKALVITEGLLVYLQPDQVRAIARDLHARPAVAWWMIDLANPSVLQMLKRQNGSDLTGSAELKFAPEEGVGFFAPFGWKPVDVKSFFREAVRFKRVPVWMRLFALLPDPDPANPGKRPWGAIARFTR